MNGKSNPPSEARLERLGRLIQLQFEARHAATREELFFHVVNNTHHALTYRQAVIWSVEGGRRGAIVAASGVPELDPDAPYIVWLTKLLAHIASAEDQNVREIGPDDIPADLRGEWVNWLPAKAAWIPMIGSKGGLLGGLFVSREEAWTEDDEYLLAQLVDSYAVAWINFIAQRPWFSRTAGRLFRGRIVWLCLALVIAAMFIPVSQTVLAPAGVVAEAPALVRSRLKGVIRQIHVQPYETVTEGQLLLDLDDTDLRNQLRLAELNLEVARAEHRLDAQKAVFDAKSKNRIQILRGRIDIQVARVKRVRDQLELIEVRATQAGVAVFDDVNDWIGRPVVAGEKIMQIAAPEAVELEAALPVSDAINFEPAAKVVFFSNIDPDKTLRARVRSSSFRATVTPEGILAYRIKAAFDTDAGKPRIGLRGTAKIYGGTTKLFYLLFRRPLSKARQWLGQ